MNMYIIYNSISSFIVLLILILWHVVSILLIEFTVHADKWMNLWYLRVLYAKLFTLFSLTIWCALLVCFYYLNTRSFQIKEGNLLFVLFLFARSENLWMYFRTNYHSCAKVVLLRVLHAKLFTLAFTQFGVFLVLFFDTRSFQIKEGNLLFLCFVLVVCTKRRSYM